MTANKTIAATAQYLYACVYTKAPGLESGQGLRIVACSKSANREAMAAFKSLISSLPSEKQFSTDDPSKLTINRGLINLQATKSTHGIPVAFLSTAAPPIESDTRLGNHIHVGLCGQFDGIETACGVIHLNGHGNAAPSLSFALRNEYLNRIEQGEISVTAEELDLFRADSINIVDPCFEDGCNRETVKNVAICVLAGLFEIAGSNYRRLVLSCNEADLFAAVQLISPLLDNLEIVKSFSFMTSIAIHDFRKAIELRLHLVGVPEVKDLGFMRGRFDQRTVSQTLFIDFEDSKQMHLNLQSVELQSQSVASELLSLLLRPNESCFKFDDFMALIQELVRCGVHPLKAVFLAIDSKQEVYRLCEALLDSNSAKTECTRFDIQLLNSLAAVCRDDPHRFKTLWLNLLILSDVDSGLELSDLLQLVPVSFWSSVYVEFFGEPHYLSTICALDRHFESSESVSQEIHQATYEKAWSKASSGSLSHEWAVHLLKQRLERHARCRIQNTSTEPLHGILVCPQFLSPGFLKYLSENILNPYVMEEWENLASVPEIQGYCVGYLCMAHLLHHDSDELAFGILQWQRNYRESELCGILTACDVFGATIKNLIALLKLREKDLVSTEMLFEGTKINWGNHENICEYDNLPLASSTMLHNEQMIEKKIVEDLCADVELSMHLLSKLYDLISDALDKRHLLTNKLDEWLQRVQYINQIIKQMAPMHRDRVSGLKTQFNELSEKIADRINSDYL